MVTTPRRGRFGIRVAAIVGAAAIVAGALTGCDEKDCRGSAASTVGARSTDGSLHEAPEGSRPRPKPKPTKSKGKKPCPPKDGGTKDKHGKEQKMFGADGERIISKTLHEGHVRGYRYRIDVENPAPGKRPGSLHVQLGGRGSTHYEYNPETKKFVTRNGSHLPRRVQQHLDNDPEARRKIRYGLQLLGER